MTYNEDLTDVSAGLSQGKSAASPTNLASGRGKGKRRLMVLPSYYEQQEQPKFEKFKSAMPGLMNRDLQTVSKSTARKSAPKSGSKYGIKLDKKKVEGYASRDALHEIKQKRENRRQYGNLAVDGVTGFKAKTKVARKSKSIVTLKNFGGRGTTTVFMRDLPSKNDWDVDKNLMNDVRWRIGRRLYAIEDIQLELEQNTEDDEEMALRPQAEQDQHSVKKQVRKSYKRNRTAPKTQMSFYKIGRVIGKGAYGKVNLAMHKLTNKLLAVKSVNTAYIKKEGAFKKLTSEINLLSSIRHPNIVKLYEVLKPTETDPPLDYYLMFMELCTGGDLLHFVRKRRKVPEKLVKQFMKQIISALGYLHHQNIVHRDIKLENILLSNLGQIKICDLGISVALPSDKSQQNLTDPPDLR